MESLPIDREWYPLNARRHYRRPEPGQLIAQHHVVWRVVRVDDVPLTEDDRQVWMDSGMPDMGTWRKRPYKLSVEWVGGVKPAWVEKHGTQGSLDVRAGARLSWFIYPAERWPQCSCCGEPMPCRAELADRQVTESLERVEQMEAIPSDACWACSEPITTRQKSVTYPGENLDLPGGQQPHFHMRRQCRGLAFKYEERWLAVDPRRERILTWPKCDGILLVHADGSSECVSDHDPVGGRRQSQPDCRGHLTHDHSAQTACFAQGNYLNPGAWGNASCPRGCKRSEHRGIGAQSPRPVRRQSDTGGLSDSMRQTGA